MNDFVLAETEEQRNKKRESLKERLIERGFEGWKLDSALKMEDQFSNQRFGLENSFQPLSKEEKGTVAILSSDRAYLIDKLHDIKLKLEPLLREKSQYESQLNEDNKKICEIQGHRLSEKTKIQRDIDCHGLSAGEWHYRTCVVCGESIYEDDLTKKDVVVKVLK